MKLLRMFFVFSVVGLFASAQAEIPKWSFGGHLGYGIDVAPSEFKDYVDEDLQFGFLIRPRISPSWTLDIGLDRNDGFKKNAVSFNAYTLSMVHHFGAKLTGWFVGLGAGYGQVSSYSSNGSHDSVVGKLKFGYEWQFAPNFSAVFGANTYLFESAQKAFSWMHIVEPVVGLTFSFGGNEPQAVAATEPVAPAPKAEQPPTEQKPMEEKVADADSDGIADEDDKCSNTAAGLKVNAFGCPESEKASIRIDVKFAPGKDIIDPASLEEVEKLAAFMKKFESTKVVIEGHTDNTGVAAKNLNLSQRRAEAVKNALIKAHGIGGERLKAIGMGSAQPVADNSTPEGRNQNRRVVATVSE